MTRKMPAGMQQYMIGRMLAGTRWDSEQYDIHANIDRTLTYSENVQNIRQQLGIQTRQRGVEQLQQRAMERQREQVRRQDSTRQTGAIQTAQGRAMDAILQAQRPGKRFSRNGNRYYERRENRSDRGKLL